MLMDEQSLNELLECSVCLDRLDHTSKVLPCQHTFCRRCLEEIVSTKGELRCPECRYLVEIPVEDLPSNILLIRLLEGIKTKSCTERSRSPGRYNDELSTASTTDKYKQAIGKLPCAKALYNYEGKDSGDLSFRKGDIIILKKQVDDNWYHGEFNSQHGFFPATYVQIVVPLPSNIPQCKTLYDFEMKDESDKKDCLFFKKDETITILKKVDDNWLEGKKGEKIGIFPISFVEMNDAAKSLINSNSNPSMHAGNFIMHERGGVEGVPQSFPLNSLVTQMPQQKRHSFTATQQKSSPPSQHNRRSLELSSSGNLVIVPSSQPPPSRTRSPPPVPTHSSQSATSASKPNSSNKTIPVITSKTTSSIEPVPSRKSDATVECQPGPAIVDASKITGINTPVYTALFNYKPHREDEIELRKGDFYNVCDKCQDGWYRGKCLKSGKAGVFPGNYVQVVRSPSAFLPVSGSVMNVRSKGTNSMSSPSSTAPSVTTTTPSGHRTSTPPSQPGSSQSHQSSLPQQQHPAPPPITPRSSKSLAKLSSSSNSSSRTGGTNRSSSSARTSSSVETSSSSSRPPTTVGPSSSSSRPSTTVGPSSSSSRPPTTVGMSSLSPRASSGIGPSSSSLRTPTSDGTKTKSPTRHANKTSSNSSMEGHLDLSVTSAHSSHRSSSSKQVVYRKPNVVGIPQPMSALSNITPPNVVAGATGEIPGIKREKKEKEKLSLVKRLTSGKNKKSKSPGHESDGSGTESIGNHVRSGSCPADSTGLLGAEGSQHVKTGSFDSTVPLVPHQKPSRPKPSVKYRCVVPYPPQGEVELELKVGDIVFVHKKREDGWYKGTLQRSGKTGLFPGSFVECDNS